MYQHKKVIMLTGGSGFVGKHFIQKYSEKYNIISVNLKNTNIEDLDFQEVDAVIHLAALVHQDNNISREEYFKVNTELTEKLAIFAKRAKVKHFIFFSTVKVYGYDGEVKNHSRVLTENDKCRVTGDLYGESKLEAERRLQILEDKFFCVSILRPPMIYGAGVKGNMKLLVSLIQTFPVLPFSYSQNRRSLVSIQNLLYCLELVIEQEKSGIFLPLDEKNISIQEMVEGIEKALALKRVNISFPPFLFHILGKLCPSIINRLYGSLQFDNSETKRKLGYHAKISYEEGIKKMLEKEKK
ncbi:NAD-dependent epimerase/dehydratase family protein [Fusobacterium necrophorum]|uniref:NAD-dependent epimerase/dehydratase family protein n=1 Tax=Fusobacterium necrophorum TaxID=859 RepID=UPI000786C33B|nr:NAD-dependent epimerase/dehydratase family protein [Fusobacterium necrophorum]KYM45230.1 UDP-N-acetylenolpyruvoylglucosamine reductase [Fusobacterium necrophorum subsp. funduliforme]